jgi:hypothetical protein
MRFLFPGVKEVVMKTISWVLLISMIFYCCACTHMINHTQSDYDKLNEKLDGEKASITLINDKVIVGENITTGLDSTSWIESAYSGEATITRTVPTLAVK